MSKNPTVLLAAGGTGGHLFPAQALAEDLIARGLRVVLVTDARFKAYGVQFTGVEVRVIQAGGRKPGWRMVVSLAKAAIGTLQAVWILLSLRPKVAVGFGGYPSFPTMLAARLFGVRSVIHEQNALLGRANRLLAGRVDRIATSFPETHGLRPQEKAKAVLTGNPVRAGVRALRMVPYVELAEGGTLRLLITGGSQGASIFSRILPAAMAALPKPLRARIRIDQQARADDLGPTRAAYEAIGMQADLASFFTDIPARLASAHLVIARSGASTVAELTVAGRPSILVPLPGSADDHQRINAQALEQGGGAWLMPQETFTAQALAARLEQILAHPETLTRASVSAHHAGQPEATQRLAELVLEAAGLQRLMFDVRED